VFLYSDNRERIRSWCKKSILDSAYNPSVLLKTAAVFYRIDEKEKFQMLFNSLLNDCAKKPFTTLTTVKFPECCTAFSELLFKVFQ
jgi:hypothetical protein